MGDTDEVDDETYFATIYAWNGGGWTEDEVVALDADSLNEAIQEAKDLEFSPDDDGDYDVLVEIESRGDPGDILWSAEIRYSSAQDAQENMDETWEDEGEFETEHLGCKGDQFYMWSSNGGARGAHDRTTGSGRWVEIYEHPREVGLGEALEWLTGHTTMDTAEAMDAMASASQHLRLAHVIAEVGDDLWRYVDDADIRVVLVRGQLFTLDGTDAEGVDRSEAIEFVEDRESDPDVIARFMDMI